MYKVLRSEVLDLRYLVGIDPESDGLRRATDAGLETSSEGLEWLLTRPQPPELIFEATSAKVHAEHASIYEREGIPAIDLTPAAVGVSVVPSVNLEQHSSAPNLNLTTCGGQATVPIVAAVSRIVDVPYAEIVSSISSRSAGPGTRANIDEFTTTTARALEVVGGAQKGKAIIVLNPAVPPILMRNTVFCAVPADAPSREIGDSVTEMVSRVSEYVPGYRLAAPPQFDPPRSGSDGLGKVAVFLEVEGAGDYLPPYAGNLDIMTAAATRVGERISRSAEGKSV